jgi:hypothetical protein
MLDRTKRVPYIPPMDPNLTTVRQRRTALAQMREQIDAEDKELEITERVLTRLAAGTTAAPPSMQIVGLNGDSGNLLTGPAAPQPVTQRDLVIATLRTFPDAWIDSSANLLTEITNAHGVAIKPSSLLPLLTTLKNEGVIRRDGANRIALAERVG